MSELKKGTKVIITHGHYKGETGTIEGSRTSASWDFMYWVRRDKKNVRISVMQFVSRWIKKAKG